MEGMQHTISKTTISKDNAVVKTTASHFFACIQTQKLARDLMKREASLRPCPLRTHFFDGDKTQKFAQHPHGKERVLASLPFAHSFL